MFHKFQNGEFSHVQFLFYEECLHSEHWLLSSVAFVTFGKHTEWPVG